MAQRMEDVIVVGAGPTGLALAAELRRLGVNALLFDDRVEHPDTSRATVVHARTLEVLEPLGVTQQLIDGGLILHKGHLRVGGEVKVTMTFDDLPTKYSYILVCPQDVTEAVLSNRLRELGGSVFRPIHVDTVTPQSDCVEASYTAAGVLIQDIRARWIVGCDGLHSAVRESAGIGFAGGNYDESFMLADVHMDWPLGRESLEIFLGEGSFVFVAPLPGNRFRIISTDANAPQHPGVEDCQRTLDIAGILGAKVHDVVWSSRFHIQHRVAAKLRQGRMLIAGDAAHVHSPAGGQGMNTGIQDAVALAEALAQTLRTGDDSVLHDWEEKRLKIARGVVSTTDTLMRLATSNSTTGHILRDVVFGILGHVPALGHQVARRLSEIDNR